MTPWRIEMLRMSDQYIKFQFVNDQSGEKRGPYVFTLKDLGEFIEWRERGESKIVLP